MVYSFYICVGLLVSAGFATLGLNTIGFIVYVGLGFPVFYALTLFTNYVWEL